MVRQDVANGFVTVVDAGERYGVVIRDGAVDVEETRRTRGRTRRESVPAFSFGPEREAYERRLPPAVQDEVGAELLEYPGSYRHFLKEQVYDVLEGNGPLDLDPVALREWIRAIVKTIRSGAALHGNARS
jgi:N-methylhydantoinase B